MIKHIVFFKFVDNSKTNIEDIANRLNNLKNEIDVIKELEVGINFAQEARAYDLALTVVVETKEDLDIYAKHPKHLPVVEYIKSLETVTKVVDYEF